MNGQGLNQEEIAALTGCAHAAGGEARVFRVAANGVADREALVFAEDAAALEAALASDAGVILARAGLPVGGDARVLPVADARYAFALCARTLAAQQPVPEQGRVHSGASVDPTATVGARVRIDAGAVVGAGAVLGNDVWIGCNAVIAEGVVLGDRVVVQAGAVLGSQGFGYVRHGSTGEYLLFPQQGALVVEDDVEIGANTTIDRGALEETRIGRGTKIDNLVHIGHNCRIGSNVVIAAQVGVSGSCVIEDGAVLAGQAGLGDHCHIGPGVILGGQSGVYPGKTMRGPGQVFSGTPAEPVREQMRSLAELRALVRQRRQR